MRSIRISDEVWEAIAAKGRFGETEDDVLRRVLNVPEQLQRSKTSSSSASVRGTLGARSGYSNNRMSADIRNDQLSISFESGERKAFSLPKKTDVNSIRHVREEAVMWARTNGASSGQEAAVKKALTTAGYHIRGSRK